MRTKWRGWRGWESSHLPGRFPPSRKQEKHAWAGRGVWVLIWSASPNPQSPAWESGKDLYCIGAERRTILCSFLEWCERMWAPFFLGFFSFCFALFFIFLFFEKVLFGPIGRSTMVFADVASRGRWNCFQAVDLHRHKIDHVTIPSQRGPAFPPLKRVEEVRGGWRETWFGFFGAFLGGFSTRVTRSSWSFWSFWSF